LLKASRLARKALARPQGWQGKHWQGLKAGKESTGKASRLARKALARPQGWQGEAEKEGKKTMRKNRNFQEKNRFQFLRTNERKTESGKIAI
jgi:hypothetical protein